MGRPSRASQVICRVRWLSLGKAQLLGSSEASDDTNTQPATGCRPSLPDHSGFATAYAAPRSLRGRAAEAPQAVGCGDNRINDPYALPSRRDRLRPANRLNRAITTGSTSCAPNLAIRPTVGELAAEL